MDFKLSFSITAVLLRDTLESAMVLQLPGAFSADGCCCLALAWGGRSRRPLLLYRHGCPHPTAAAERTEQV